MFDLLVINGYTCPKPASFKVDTTDKTNEFEAENGARTIEVIREGIIKISVSYGSLTAAGLQGIRQHAAKN